MLTQGEDGRIINFRNNHYNNSVTTKTLRGYVFIPTDNTMADDGCNDDLPVRVDARIVYDTRYRHSERTHWL